MSAYQVKDAICSAIDDETNALVVANFANGDMVGHTGNLQASIKAVEVLDECVGSIMQKVLEKDNIFACVTADHGNCEKMHGKNGIPFTQHTIFPVPFILISHDFLNSSCRMNNGILADIAPTILHLLGITAKLDPAFDKQRRGKTLIKKL